MPMVCVKSLAPNSHDIKVLASFCWVGFHIWLYSSCTAGTTCSFICHRRPCIWCQSWCIRIPRELKGTSPLLGMCRLADDAFWRWTSQYSFKHKWLHNQCLGDLLYHIHMLVACETMRLRINTKHKQDPGSFVHAYVVPPTMKLAV